MKIAILNDTHAGARNSSDIFINYQEKFYSEIFFPYLKENNIKNIIHLGDYYDHRKYINFKVQNANRKMFLDKLREYGITMDIIPGNHDVFYKNTNELNSLKELLGYYKDVVNIYMEPTVVDYDGCDIALLPWINQENHNDSMKFLKECKAQIVGAHLELNNFDMMKGVKATHGMSTSHFSRFDIVLSGHYHTKSSQENIHYLGSQMEFTWADCEDPKYFHIFDTDMRELTPVHNPLTLFKKIYYDDKCDESGSCEDYLSRDLDIDGNFVKVVVVNKRDPFVFDKFIDKISKCDIHELKIAENFEEFMGENVEDTTVKIEDTTTLIDEYIDLTETDLNKERIKTIMKSLFVEANNLDIS